MLRIKSGTDEINVPTSWADVTLGMHILAQKAITENKTAPDQLLGIIAALCCISVKQARSLDSDVADAIADHLAFYLTVPVPITVVDSIEIGGQVMVVPQKIGRRSFGEFVDLDNLMVQSKDFPVESVPEVLSIYCRPEGEAYDPDVTAQRIEAFKSLPVPVAESLAAFFLTKPSSSGMLSSRYGHLAVLLESKARTLSGSGRSMAGSRPSPRWLRMMFSRWIRSSADRAMKS